VPGQPLKPPDLKMEREASFGKESVPEFKGEIAKLDFSNVKMGGLPAKGGIFEESAEEDNDDGKVQKREIKLKNFWDVTLQSRNAKARINKEHKSRLFP